MNLSAKHIGIIETTDDDGGNAFVLLMQREGHMIIAVSQEHNGDACVPLTVDQCELIREMLLQGILLIKSGDVTL